MRRNDEIIDNQIDWLCTYTDYLNPWQRSFVSDLNGLPDNARLTPKQIDELEETVRQAKAVLKYGEIYGRHSPITKLLAREASFIDEDYD